MRRLGQESEVVQLAAELHVDWRQNAVENIMALCHSKILGWLQDSVKISTIQELERLVCRRLKLVFEMVWSDEDLSQIIRKYVGLGEPIFATLRDQLDSKTYGSLIERRRITGTSKDRYVAVIDCRGVKAARRFFTRWHEIAHLLTLHGQLELPLHRSSNSPTERLMDAIAGEIGFYEPLFGPVLAEELAKERFLTFGTVERIRQRFCPDASFQATLNACVNRLGSAALVMEARIGYKKSEQRELDSRQRQLIQSVAPRAKLRVYSVAGNKRAVRSQLKVHQNMQVPPASLIYKLFVNDGGTVRSEIAGVESLGVWRHSDGSSLANIAVRIEARRLPDSVLALVLPV